MSIMSHYSEDSGMPQYKPEWRTY